MTTLVTPRPLRICIFGAAGDTGNLGVSALLHSALGGVARYAPDTELTIFDNGWGVRTAETKHGDRSLPHRACGARFSRRIHRPESFMNMRLASLFGGLGNKGAHAVRNADAVWDISGGDSFGDLYGERRWRATVEPKRLCLLNKRPLVLLPQTYGPFRTPRIRAESIEILRRTRLAWARDSHSFEILRDLLGSEFDSERHRAGVDMAFALESYAPRAGVPERLEKWMASGAGPLVGINISGLIYNDPRASLKYELTLDYGEFLHKLVQRFLTETEANILFVPHVIPARNALESDREAAKSLVEALPGAQQERAFVLPAGFDQCETKWFISKMDWFCGTRMHACIGGMSSGIPTAGLAYSLKFQGVFESCGQGAEVIDLRSSETEGALRDTWNSWERRAAIRRSLEEFMPPIRSRAGEEIEETLEVTAAEVR